jgi:hypothetical protein
MCVISPRSRPEASAWARTLQVRRARPAAGVPTDRRRSSFSPLTSVPSLLPFLSCRRGKASVNSLALSLPCGSLIDVLSPDTARGGFFRISSKVRADLEPGAGGVATWSRDTVLRHAAAQGLVVEEMRPDGEWDRLDPEAEAAAAAAAALAAALAAAVAGDLVLSGTDFGHFRIPAAARAVLEPGVTSATSWTRASILRRAAAQGLVVSGMQPDEE